MASAFESLTGTPAYQTAFGPLITGVKYGDINGNGKIDSADAVAIKKYLAGYSDTINKKAADVTGDGKIDVNDAIRLLKYLAGYDVTLGAA